MARFRFWQQWLFYTSLLFVGFGILLAIYGDNPLFKHYNNALARRFWGQPQFPVHADQFRAFISAALGGTIACSYILLAYIAYYPFRRRERWSYYAIAAAFGVWIVIDTVTGLYYKAYFPYIIHSFSFLVKALPLIFTWKYFFR